MATKNLFQELLEEFEDDLDFKVEGVAFDITEQICEIIKEQGISRADLSRLLDTSKSAVTKMLDGSANFTLKRLIKIAMVLNKNLNVQFTEPKKKSNFNDIEKSTSILQQTEMDSWENWNEIHETPPQEQKELEFDQAA